jgi:VanZ family protein
MTLYVCCFLKKYPFLLALNLMMKKLSLLFSVGFYLWLIAVIILTSMSFKEGPEKFSDSNFRWDYLNHFFMYFFIPVLYKFSKGAGLNKIIKKSLVIFFLGIAFLVITEVYQLWIPGRSFNFIDLMLNLSGFLVGTGLIMLKRHKINLAK